MTRSFWRAVFPVLLFIWTATLIVGYASTEGLFRALSNASDADLFTPGRLMLFEHLRVSIREVGAAVVMGALAFAIGHMALVLGRARLNAVTFDTLSHRRDYRPLLDRTGSFLGLTIVQWIIQCAFFLGWGALLFALPSPEGTIDPARLSVLGLVGIAGVVLHVSCAALFEIWRLCLFRDSSSESALGLAWRTLERRAGTLVVARLLRASLSVALGVFVLKTALSPPTQGLWGGALVFFQGQLAVIAALIIEVLWLTFVHGKLAPPPAPEVRVPKVPAPIFQA